MGRTYIRAESAMDWKRLLADPDKHWKTGFSARTLAHSWQEADGTGGFPREVAAVLKGHADLADCELLLALPEHQVQLPGGARPSQSDIWVLAARPAHSAGSNAKRLVSMTIEGKVDETFGPTLGEWFDDTPGKRTRLAYLLGQLGLQARPPEKLRYQLLHRTASAVIEARRVGASQAVMLVHSFSPTGQWFDDYAAFVALWGHAGAKNAIVDLGQVDGIALYVGWISGDQRMRER